MSTDPMQLPLLDPSLYGENDDCAVVWQPSGDFTKARGPNHDNNHGQTVIPTGDQDAPDVIAPPLSKRALALARFGVTSLAFAVNSFLCQSSVFFGRDRYRDIYLRLTPLVDRWVESAHLSDSVVAAAREASCVLLWSALIVAEFYLVRAAALRLMAWRTGRGAVDDRDSSRNYDAARDKAVRARHADAVPVPEHFDGAFTVGSTLGCAIYVAAVYGLGGARGDPPQTIGAWAFVVWAAVLVAAMILGCVPLVRSMARKEGGAYRDAKDRRTEETSCEQC